MLRGADRSPARLSAAATRKLGNVLAGATSMVVESLEGRRLLSAGDLDTSFGTGGFVRENFNSFASGAAVAIQHGATPAGDKILIAGSVNGAPAVMRFDSYGAPDLGFGTGGVVALSGEAVVDVEVATYGTASTADDKIVVTGQMSGPIAYVTRLDGSTGALDTSFGGTGLVALATAGTQTPADAAVDIFGNVFVTGTDDTGTVVNTFLTKLDNDGTPDSSFGTGPFAGTSIVSLDSLQEQVSSIALQGNNIVVAGQMAFLAGVARFDDFGALDSSFGTGGISAGSNADLTVNRVIVSPAGEIYTLDSYAADPFNAGIALRHYVGTNGAFDAAFGTGHNTVDRASNGVNMPGTGLVMTSDGSFLATSHYFDSLLGESHVTIARFTPAGALDTSFRGGGLVVEPGSGFDVSVGIAIQGDDKAVVVGYDAGGNVIAARYETQNAVSNSAPSVTANQASLTVVQGQTANNTGTFSDVDAGDIVTITASVGTITQAGSQSGTWSWSASTAALSSQTITITATDNHGNFSTTSFALNVTPQAQIVGANLVVTPASASSNVRVSMVSGLVQVIIDGTTVGSFSPTGNVVVNSGSGADLITISVSGGLGMVVDAGGGNDVVVVSGGSATVRGGAGNDIVASSGGSDIIIGGDGNDVIVGGGGRDVMIGGAGADIVAGSIDDDIIIAGTTSYDNNQPALDAIMSEWRSSRTYATRVANIRGTGVLVGPRNNGSFFFDPDVTVFDDAAVDILSGGSGTDWFLFNSDTGVRDLVTDRTGQEILTDVDVQPPA